MRITRSPRPVSRWVPSSHAREVPRAYIKAHSANNQNTAQPVQTMGPSPVAAVVLAAGLSRRLGRPKALVSINGSTLVVNDDPDAGRTRSLQLGCAALVDQRGSIPERLLLAPVDRPAWNIEILEALLNTSTSSAPAHEGRRGHPVLLDQVAIEAVVSAKADASLRALVSFAPVPVEAPWLHHNIDTEADVDRLLEDESALLACFFRGEGI